MKIRSWGQTAEIHSLMTFLPPRMVVSVFLAGAESAADVGQHRPSVASPTQPSRARRTNIHSQRSRQHNRRFNFCRLSPQVLHEGTNHTIVEGPPIVCPPRSTCRYLSFQVRPDHSTHCYRRRWALRELLRNYPSAGSPTDNLLRILLPVNG